MYSNVNVLKEHLKKKYVTCGIFFFKCDTITLVIAPNTSLDVLGVPPNRCKHQLWVFLFHKLHKKRKKAHFFKVVLFK